MNYLAAFSELGVWYIIHQESHSGAGPDATKAMSESDVEIFVGLVRIRSECVN